MSDLRLRWLTLIAFAFGTNGADLDVVEDIVGHAGPPLAFKSKFNSARAGMGGIVVGSANILDRERSRQNLFSFAFENAQKHICPLADAEIRPVTKVDAVVRVIFVELYQLGITLELFEGFDQLAQARISALRIRELKEFLGGLGKVEIAGGGADECTGDSFGK